MYCVIYSECLHEQGVHSHLLQDHLPYYCVCTYACEVGVTRYNALRMLVHHSTISVVQSSVYRLPAKQAF